MNPQTLPTTVSTQVLIAALVAFLCPILVHQIEASDFGSRIPESLRPKLAAVGGLAAGALQALLQGQDWKFLLLSALATGATSIGGVSAPIGSNPLDARLRAAVRATLESDSKRTQNANRAALVTAALCALLGFTVAADGGCNPATGKVDPNTAGSVSSGIAGLLCGAIDLVPLIAPSSSGAVVAGTVCQDAQPYVGPAVSAFVNLLEGNARVALTKRAATDGSYATFAWRGKIAGTVRPELCDSVSPTRACVGGVQAAIDASAADGGAK